MHLSLKRLLIEIILEAVFGKKFKLRVTKNGTQKEHIGMATANSKPGERPYRITWFSLSNYAASFPENRHVDLTFEEMKSILDTKTFPPEIVERTRRKYPNDSDDLIGDNYELL